MFPKEHVLSIWNGELDQTREWGGLVTMVMHPQVTGRPMRLGIFRDFISRARGFGDVWIATGAEIAETFHPAGRGCQVTSTFARCSPRCTGRSFGAK